MRAHQFEKSLQFNRYHQLQVNAAFLGRKVTMVNECEQSTTTLSTHVKKKFQMTTFHDGLKVWMDSYHHHACPGSYLKYRFSINKAKYDNPIGESMWQSLHYLICTITHGLCSYNVQLFNDDSLGNWNLLLVGKGILKLCTVPPW